MRYYIGRDWHRVTVREVEAGPHDVCWPPGEWPLDPGREVLDLSWGFTWGTMMRSCDQLAFAILRSEFGDEFAVANYTSFRQGIIGRMQRTGTRDPLLSWSLSSTAVQAWRAQREKRLTGEAEKRAREGLEKAIAEGRVKVRS